MNYLKRIAEYYNLQLYELIAAFAIGLIVTIGLAVVWHFIAIALGGLD